MTRALFLAVITTAVLTSAASAQSEQFDIQTTASHPILTPDPPDYTFGVTADPDGTHVWATVSGTIAFNPAGAWNNRLLKIDTNIGGVVDQAVVGLFPEDIALRLDGNGETEHVWVTGNGSSDVTAVDASTMQVVGTVNLGLCFGSYSNFPFEMAMTPAQDRLFVGTSGCGNLFEIDPDPSSPTFLQLTTLLTGTGAGGSLHIHPAHPNTLLTGSSEGFNMFAGAVARLNFIDHTQTAPAVTTLDLGAPFVGDFASATDIVPLSNGDVLVVENSQTFARVYLVNVTSQQIVDVYDLQQRHPALANLHQADIDADERILVVTSLLDDIVFYDIESRNVVSTLSYPNAQPNCVVFTNQGDRIVTTFQNDESVRIFDDLPVGLKASAGGPANLGQPLNLVTQGGPSLDIAYWFLSTNGAGPTTITLGYTALLGAPFDFFFDVICDAAGNGSVTFPVPSSPSFVNTSADLQAVTFQPQSILRLSNPLNITIVP